MEFYSSLSMMRTTHTHTSQFAMLQGQGPHYIKSTIDYVNYLVTKTEEQGNLYGRNISTDCLYTIVELPKWLLTRNITVGTVQKSQHGIPHELFDVKGREKFSLTCY